MSGKRWKRRCEGKEGRKREGGKGKKKRNGGYCRQAHKASKLLGWLKCLMFSETVYRKTQTNLFGQPNMANFLANRHISGGKNSPLRVGNHVFQCGILCTWCYPKNLKNWLVHRALWETQPLFFKWLIFTSVYYILIQALNMGYAI